MKARIIYGCVMILVLTAAVGIGMSPIRTPRALPSSPTARAKFAPDILFPGATPLIGVEDRVNPSSAPGGPSSSPTIGDLKAELDHLSDDELKQFAAQATQRVQRMLANDPTGRSRSVTETEKLGLALNQESAARLILIDRSLEAARKKYL